MLGDCTQAHKSENSKIFQIRVYSFLLTLFGVRKQYDFVNNKALHEDFNISSMRSEGIFSKNTE